jgi:hypothetical protein
MKPTCPRENGRRGFPHTDYFFHSGIGRWHDFWSASGGEGEPDGRRFNEFTREFLLASARERKTEMIVFGVVVLAAAWPVVYMVISVVELLAKGHPLDH